MPKPALLVIDVLEEFVNGRLSTQEARSIIGPAKKVIEEFRRRKLPIIYLKDSHYDTDFELRVWGKHAMSYEDSSRIVEDLRPDVDEPVIEKHVYSGFFGTPLDYILRSKGVTHVFLLGLDADICVRHTAADAFYRGYYIYVIRDATAAYLDKSWEEYFKRVYGAQVLNSDEVQRALNSLS